MALSNRCSIATLRTTSLHQLGPTGLKPAAPCSSVLRIVV
jgi:hypothetical protein